MSSLRIFYKTDNKIKISRNLSILKSIDRKDIVWIDLIDASEYTEGE